MDQQQMTARQFGSTAAHYLTSSIHATGADLDRLIAAGKTLRPAAALDLGCGAGHASFALARAGVPHVIAYDLSPRMLGVVEAEAMARQHPQIQTRAGAAEHLEFADASFDLVVTRYSAHHWLDVNAALREISRVLKPNGTVLIIDVIAPEQALLDTTLQTVELLRDPSHVRDYRESEWRGMLTAAKFSAPQTHRWKLPLEFASWVARIGTSEPRVAALQMVIDALPAEAHDYFAVTSERSFVIDSAWFAATKV